MWRDQIFGPQNAVELANNRANGTFHEGLAGDTNVGKQLANNADPMQQALLDFFKVICVCKRGFPQDHGGGNDFLPGF